MKKINIYYIIMILCLLIPGCNNKIHSYGEERRTILLKIDEVDYELKMIRYVEKISNRSGEVQEIKIKYYPAFLINTAVIDQYSVNSAEGSDSLDVRGVLYQSTPEKNVVYHVDEHGVVMIHGFNWSTDLWDASSNDTCIRELINQSKRDRQTIPSNHKGTDKRSPPSDKNPLDVEGK